MRAGFDPDHQMRVLEFTTSPELDECARVAETVQQLPDTPDGIFRFASFIMSLADSVKIVPETGDVPPICGRDADRLIITLDTGARHSESEAQRMFARSLLFQITAQGVDIDAVLAA